MGYSLIFLLMLPPFVCHAEARRVAWRVCVRDGHIDRSSIAHFVPFPYTLTVTNERSDATVRVKVSG